MTDNHHHRHDVFHHSDAQVEDRLRGVDMKLGLVIKQMEKIMATIADLQAAVARNTDAEASVVTLLRGISQQLKDAKASGDPAALDAVIKQLDDNTTNLGSAVVENTPAA